MPEKKVVAPFKTDPNFDRISYVKKQVEQYHSYFEKELTIIDQIPDSHLQYLCLYAYIDALAFESIGYKRAGADVDIFTEFILRCNTRYDYLDKVEPATLYYHVEEYIAKSVKIPSFPEELDIEIDSFVWEHTLFKDSITQGFSNKLTDYIIMKKGREFTEKKIKEHRLVNLLYRMRSKLVHEMSSPGMDNSFENTDNFEEPYYSECGRAYCEDNYLVSDDVIELHIPYVFIRNILEDCFNHYLDECIRLNRTPFSNNKMTRRHVLSWYDK